MFNDARLINLLANTLTVTAVLMLCIAGVVWVAKRPYFAIARITIEPDKTETLQFVSSATVRATISGRLKGNFFFTDLDHVRELIETTPWVRKAHVRRVWPNTLRVSIEEQQPLAFWNQDQMINTWGESFTANKGELPEHAYLPSLKGPDASERLVVQRYADIARIFAPLNLRVQEVSLSPRYAWEVTLQGGVNLELGRDPAADVADPHGRSGALPFAERIERFVQAWPALVANLNGQKLLTADLRYPNGFAITLSNPDSLIKQ